MESIANRKTRNANSAKGFTLVELLVVIGIIALLIGIMMPSLSKARASAEWVACQSNLRQLGIILKTYENDNNGWLFPVGPIDSSGDPTTFGTNVPPNQRWPMHVPAFDIPAPNPLPFDPEQYVSSTYDPVKFPVEPFTPPILRCPSDQEPAEAHSYVLNRHLADKKIRSGRSLGGFSSSEVIVVGEKKSSIRDYYMENEDYDRVVEQFRHGVNMGSNYLFMDGSVGNMPPSDAKRGIDPWDPPVPPPPKTDQK